MRLVSSLVIVGIVATLGSSASAHPSTPSSAGEPQGVETCVLNMASGSFRCYPSTQAMLDDRTQGAVRAATRQELMDQETVQAIEAAASSVITAILYDDDGAEGGPRLLMEAPNGCDADRDIDWQWGSLRSDWTDRINSGRGYSRCQVKVWSGANFTGSYYPWFSLTSSMGAMNNHTDSVKMR